MTEQDFKTALQRKKEEQLKLIEKEYKRLKRDMATVAGTAEGRSILKHIMNECGYQTPSIVANPQTMEINANATTHNEARRSLWLTLRKFIDREALIIIELPAVVEIEDGTENEG